jgi:alpha-L-fucosidase
VQCTTIPTDSLPVVIRLDIEGPPDVDIPPRITAPFDIFIDSTRVVMESDRRNIGIHYTLDGSEPTNGSPLCAGPVVVRSSSTFSARCFRNDLPVSPVAHRTFTRVTPVAGVDLRNPQQGLRYAYYEGTWDSLPDFGALQPRKEGWCAEFDLSPRQQRDHFAFVYSGNIHIAVSGVYGFALESDDGSRLYIDDALAVDNNGLHGRLKKEGVVALAKGYHRIRVEFFEKDGNDALAVSVRTATGKLVRIPQDFLFHNR